MTPNFQQNEVKSLLDFQDGDFLYFNPDDGDVSVYIQDGDVSRQATVDDMVQDFSLNPNNLELSDGVDAESTKKENQRNN